jgi:hypothetical protein
MGQNWQIQGHENLGFSYKLDFICLSAESKLGCDSLVQNFDCKKHELKALLKAIQAN